MDNKKYIEHLYKSNPTKYFFHSLDEILKFKDNLEVVNDTYAIIVDNIIYAYNNLKGFSPLFLKKPYEIIYLNDEEYKRIKIEQNSRFKYDDQIIYKVFNDNLEYYTNEEPCEDIVYTKWHILTFKELKHITSKALLEQKFEEIKFTSYKPSLLLHSCCGPCSSQVLSHLHDYFDITIYYSNSNIDTLEEFNKRIAEQEKIISSLGYDIKVIEDFYNPTDYDNAVKGLEALGEFSKRCYNCYYFRIERSAKYASINKFDYFTTTLSISPYKNSDWINEIGESLSNKYRIEFLYSNFKLDNGYQKSIDLSKKYNLYRQDYCGCKYSKNKQ